MEALYKNERKVSEMPRESIPAGLFGRRFPLRESVPVSEVGVNEKGL